MNCQDFHNYISPYIDNVLNDDEKHFFEKHLSQCEKCRAEYYNFKALIESVNEIQEVALPKNFSKELGEKLRNEKIKKNRWTPKRKLVSGIAAAAIFTVASVSILLNSPPHRGTTQSTEMAAMDSAAAPQMEAAEESGSDPVLARENSMGIMNTQDIAQKQVLDQESEVQVLNDGVEEILTMDRKIIQRGNIAIEVEDFDATYGRVLDVVEGFNGYIQHSDIYYNFLDRENPGNSLKNASIQLRVPSGDFNTVFQELKVLGIVVEENRSDKSITETYIDIDNQVKNLELQEERLREILAKAESVDELLILENELNRIRTQINSLTGRLQGFDKLLSMSTIDLHIRQVREKNINIQSFNEGLWERSKNSFIASVNNIIKGFDKLFVGFFSALPILILITGIGGPIGYIIYKKGWLKR